METVFGYMNWAREFVAEYWLRALALILMGFALRTLRRFWRNRQAAIQQARQAAQQVAQQATVTPVIMPSGQTLYRSTSHPHPQPPAPRSWGGLEWAIVVVAGLGLVAVALNFFVIPAYQAMTRPQPVRIVVVTPTPTITPYVVTATPPPPTATDRVVTATPLPSATPTTVIQVVTTTPVPPSPTAHVVTATPPPPTATDRVVTATPLPSATPTPVIQVVTATPDPQGPTSMLVPSGQGSRNTNPARAVPDSPVRGTGSFRSPLTGYVITQYFGWGHNGVDLATTLGSPVYAADTGRVIWSEWDSNGYGYTVVIDHGNGYRTRYARLSWILVGFGEHVAKGQQIGKVGNSGRSTGPHLHFEVLLHGVAKNPFDYIK